MRAILRERLGGRIRPDQSKYAAAASEFVFNGLPCMKNSLGGKKERWRESFTRLSYLRASLLARFIEPESHIWAAVANMFPKRELRLQPSHGFVLRRVCDSACPVRRPSRLPT